MRRFLIICMLAVFVPLGHGLAEERVNPEDAFFDAIVNDDGELVEITDEFYRETLVPLLTNVYKERFGCVETAHEAGYWRQYRDDEYKPEYFLSDHIHEFLVDTYSPQRLFIQESRYMVFSGCISNSCDTEGLYIIDTIKKDFAVTIRGFDSLLGPRITDRFTHQRSNGNTIGGSKYTRGQVVELFLSHRALETFKYKAAMITVDWINRDYYDYQREKKPSERLVKPLEFFYVDCRKNPYW